MTKSEIDLYVDLMIERFGTIGDYEAERMGKTSLAVDYEERRRLVAAVFGEKDK